MPSGAVVSATARVAERARARVEARVEARPREREVGQLQTPEVQTAYEIATGRVLVVAAVHEHPMRAKELDVKPFAGRLLAVLVARPAAAGREAHRRATCASYQGGIHQVGARLFGAMRDGRDFLDLKPAHVQHPREHVAHLPPSKAVA